MQRLTTPTLSCRHGGGGRRNRPVAGKRRRWEGEGGGQQEREGERYQCGQAEVESESAAAMVGQGKRWSESPPPRSTSRPRRVGAAMVRKRGRQAFLLGRSRRRDREALDWFTCHGRCGLEVMLDGLCSVGAERSRVFCWASWAKE
jgi:hypothetical protein